LKQYVDRPSGESAIAAETFMNNAGYAPEIRTPQ